jgi:5'(3')-deoxyribonucleotidase
MSSKKRTILIDLDEVVYPFLQTWDTWLRTQHGKTIDWEAFVWWYDLDLYLYGHLDLMPDFIAYNGVREAKPIMGSVEALAELSKHYDIIACTARNEADWGLLTKEWVREHLPFVKEIVHVRKGHGDDAIPKGEIARLYTAKALIDDTAAWMATLPIGTDGYVLKRPAPLASDPGAQDWSEILNNLINR